jgi:predicted permease
MALNVIRRVRYWLRLRTREDELREEIEFHREMKRQELEREGLPQDEARFAARRAMGNATLAREDARAVWIWPRLEQLLQDSRYAGRVLAKRPGFTVAAVSILALGVGITTAMFTVVDALILRPVPFHAPDDLASVYMGNERGGRTTVAPAVLRAWRGSPAFAGAESALPDTALIDADGTVVTRGIARVTPGLFDLLGGVRPVIGRLFDPLEGRAGSDDRVLISEDVWRGLYRADPSLIGRRIAIDGDALLVTGVLPGEFRFPKWDTVIWRPLNFDALPPAQANARASAYVRFAPGMPRADALRLAMDAARAADPATAKLWPRAEPLAGMVLDNYYQRAVPLLAGGVLLVFFVLCANLSSLLLSRLTARRREFSMCSALGASRARLIRQAFLESAFIGVLGVICGLGLAWALVSLSRGFLPEAFLLRTLNPLNIDPRALAVAAACGLAATIAAGLLPAWIATRVDAGHSLRVTERGGTETRGARAVTRTLLVVEIALACTLLVSATLLVRSFINLSRAERGLETSGVITATMSLPESAFPNRQARTAAASSIEDRLRQLPSVQHVAWSYGQPPDGGMISWGDWIPDAPGAPAVHMMLERYRVGPEFFALYSIPILRGRTFEPADNPGQVIVGERLASALWPGLDPIGRSFGFGKERFHVVGLAREIHHPSLDPRLDRPEFYEPFSGVGSYAMISIRCGGTCPDPALVRQRLGATHPGVRLIEVRPLEDLYFEQLARPRAAAALGFAFAAIAVLAAAGGLFSVLSYAVAQRRREFGIRAALGASPGQLRRLVLRDGGLVALVGVALGTGAAWLLARGLASLQYGVAVSDPVSWALVLGVIAATTMAASWRPAREAMRVDPVLLLRDE